MKGKSFFRDVILFLSQTTWEGKNTTRAGHHPCGNMGDLGAAKFSLGGPARKRMF